ncbi:MAG: LLM class flavin-dependent oxidoreductase [bacterium]|nr:LLM class flavin-dependent oxidoreductase [bacterium]MDE0289384.1 LLM class flavin-dependent oxidoreductase [bacterium]MDE0439454.1 LLM class flavin-dependent oxidoreductase [bacterium]
MSGWGASLQIGFQVWAQNVAWQDLMDAAAAIEDRGFDSLWSNDHFFPIAGYELEINQHIEGPIFEGWMTLAGFVARTRRINLGCMVSAAGYRNPGLLVKMASTLDHASGGRLVLGLGAGWYERDHVGFGYEYPAPAGRLDRMEETVIAVRGLLDGDTVTMDGRWVRMLSARNDPAPLQHRLPLLVGGSGERRTLPVVARYADWWNGEGTPAEIAGKNAAIDRLCEAAGRNPSEIFRTVGLPPPLVRESRSEAVDKLTATLVGHGMPPEQARMTAAGSEVVGPLGQVAEALARYADAGVAQAVFDWPPPFDEETLDALAILRRELGPGR